MYTTSALTWSNLHQHGTLWHQHLRLRHDLFVCEKGWIVPNNGNVEWDQYDTGNTHYLITHTQGKAVAASRLNPCDFQSTQGSFMIRDAVLGKLPGIPSSILNDADVPVSKDVLEATRFTVDPSFDRKTKMTALAQNARDLAAYAKLLGARKLLALMPPFYARWLTRLGLPTEQIGPTVHDGNGEPCCVIQMDLY